MTPVDITHFSEALRAQKRSSGLKLKTTSPLFTIKHPCLIKHELAPGSLSNKNQSWGIQFQPFQGPSSSATRGHPAAIGKFITSGTQEHFHFDSIGCVTLSKADLPETTGNSLVMQEWLDYALSPELWGPDGKWIRFHARLQKAFTDASLLADGSMPGYYPLKKNAEALNRSGFLGDVGSDLYSLTLPWDFSLTSLGELEAAIRQEF